MINPVNAKNKKRTYEWRGRGPFRKQYFKGFELLNRVIFTSSFRYNLYDKGFPRSAQEPNSIIFNSQTDQHVCMGRKYGFRIVRNK